jgi:hypothetical protein
VRRRVVALVGCVVLIVGTLPVSAAGPAWRIFGPYSAKLPETCFYNSADISRSENIRTAWTKCLDRNDLNKAVKNDTTGALSDIVADKIAHSYVPSVARVEHLEGDQFIDAVFDEELANTGNLRPLRTVLLEVDCTKKKMREISSIKPADGQLRMSDTPQDWRSVTPVGGGSSLSVLLCGNPPSIRSPVRYATHAAARSHRRYRSNELR